LETRRWNSTTHQQHTTRTKHIDQNTYRDLISYNMDQERKPKASNISKQCSTRSPIPGKKLMADICPTASQCGHHSAVA